MGTGASCTKNKLAGKDVVGPASTDVKQLPVSVLSTSSKDTDNSGTTVHFQLLVGGVTRLAEFFARTKLTHVGPG